MPLFPYRYGCNHEIAWRIISACDARDFPSNTQQRKEKMIVSWWEFCNSQLCVTSCKFGKLWLFATIWNTTTSTQNKIFKIRESISLECGKFVNSLLYILIFDCYEEFSLWDEMRAIGYAAIFSDNQKFENINQNQNN